MKKLIFLVEDDTDIREMIEYLLEHKEYAVVSFANAELFKKNLGGSAPDLIILDIMLPDGNGEDICRELKANEKTNPIPILLMSANISAEPSANDFIGKPFDIDEMLKKVKVLAGA